jgi:hypothetical protein
MAKGPGFFEAQLESMSPRDRMLLTGLIMFGAVVFGGLLWWTLSGMLEDRASRVRDAKFQYESVLLARNDYLDAADAIRANEDRLRTFKGKRLSAFLEDVAAENEVPQALDKVEKGESELVGSFTQTTYNFTFKKVPMEAAMNIMYEIETGFPLKVTDATFKVSYVKREKVLDLVLEVVVYELTEA